MISADGSPLTFQCTRLPSQLPNELIDMVVDYLYDDNASLKACILSGRCFVAPSRHHLFQHITLNSPERMEYCLGSLNALPGETIFQHARVFDIGYPCEGEFTRFWELMIQICTNVAETRKIKGIWWSNVCFDQLSVEQVPALLLALISLSETVTELGIYECTFNSIEDLVSISHVFPLCSNLFVRGCSYRSHQDVVVLGLFPIHKISPVNFTVEHESYQNLDTFFLLQLIWRSCDGSIAMYAASMRRDRCLIARVKLWNISSFRTGSGWLTFFVSFTICLPRWRS